MYVSVFVIKLEDIFGNDNNIIYILFIVYLYILDIE